MVKKDSFRADMLDHFVHYANETNSKIVLQTSSGFILGNPITGKELNDPLWHTIIENFNENRQEKLETFTEEEKENFSTQAVLLADVTVLSSQTITLSYLVVLTNEISSFSLSKD